MNPTAGVSKLKMACNETNLFFNCSAMIWKSGVSLTSKNLVVAVPLIVRGDPDFLAFRGGLKGLRPLAEHQKDSLPPHTMRLDLSAKWVRHL